MGRISYLSRIGDIRGRELISILEKPLSPGVLQDEKRALMDIDEILDSKLLDLLDGKIDDSKYSTPELEQIKKLAEFGDYLVQTILNMDAVKEDITVRDLLGYAKDYIDGYEKEVKKREKRKK